MRMRAAVLILALSVAMPANARALTKADKPPAWVCAMVLQQLYTLYQGNVAEAEKGARARGYSTADIARGRLCL